MGDKGVGNGVVRHKSDSRREGVCDASVVVRVRRGGRRPRDKVPISNRELVECASIFIVNVLSIKTIEPRKHSATKSLAFISAIGNLRVGKTNTSRRASLGLLVQAERL